MGNSTSEQRVERTQLANPQARVSGTGSRSPRPLGSSEPVDAGSLRIARYLEPFSLLRRQLTYEGDEGPEIAYRFERFAQQASRFNERTA